MSMSMSFLCKVPELYLYFSVFFSAFRSAFFFSCCVCGLYNVLIHSDHKRAFLHRHRFIARVLSGQDSVAHRLCFHRFRL